MAEKSILNLGDRSSLSISVRQQGTFFVIEMAVVTRPRSRMGKVERRVLSRKTCESESILWVTLQEFSASRLVDLAELNMDPNQ